MPITFDPHSNFAYSTVQAGSSIIGSTGSPKTIVLNSGDGVAFPDNGGILGDYNVIVWPANQRPLLSNAEIIRVSQSADTLTTVARAQEGTTALSTIAAGYQVMAGVTAKFATDIETVAAGFAYQVVNQAFNVSIANTVTETSLFSYTIPGGSLGTTKQAILKMDGEFQQNSGSQTDVVRFKTKLGGVTIIDSGITGSNAHIVEDADRYPWWMEVTIIQINSALVQWVKMEGDMMWHRGSNGGVSRTDWAVGMGMAPSWHDSGTPVDLFHYWGAGAGAIDMASDQLFEFTVQLPTAINTDITAKSLMFAYLG